MIRRRGFTLIELLVSTGIAMALASLATTAFIQLSKTVARMEARMAMHTSAQRLYTQLNRTFACMQQSCAFVARSTLDTDVRLIFMRAREQEWNYGQAGPGETINPDLVWEEWVWTRADQTLRVGANTPQRSFQVGGSFSPAGVNYQTRTFIATPQPRRTLTVADPTGSAAGGLNDNIYFPNGSTPAVSQANANDDIGDFTELERNLMPVLDRVSDLSFEIITHDGTAVTLDDSASTVPPRVFQGVWLDGRMAASLSAAPAYATSELAKRPRLLRMRFTMTDAKLKITCPFSFSFALPGLAATP